MTTSDLTTGRRVGGGAGGRVRWLLPALLLIVGCGGKAIPGPQDFGGGKDQQKPAPKFAGKAVPDPPSQGAPWTPPATRLPRSLVDATTALFELGAADPRGCEYREVEVGDWRVEKARGFVLPGRPGEVGRFVVGWDGVVRPALTVGARADLEADVRALADVLKTSRDAPQFNEYVSVSVSSDNPVATTTEHRDAISPFFDNREPAPDVPRSPLTLCLLLRLGRADLAGSLYAAATGWTPDNARPDLTDEPISFPTLSALWANILYDRLIGAHCRGDDVIALDAARRLDRFRKGAPAKAEALGFKPEVPHLPSYKDPAHVRNAAVVTDLLADHERRGKESPRGPVPPRGGDPAVRAAALIRDFDQIYVNTPMVNYTGGEPGDGAIVSEVVAEGDAAVGPLLAALESDTRLTRCVMSRNGIDHLGTVTEAVYRALQRLLKTEHLMDDRSDYTQMQTIEGRKRLAGAARALWEKNRAVPLIERWYRTLRDDSAGTARWLEAATGLVQRPGSGAPFMGYFTVRGSGQPPTALMGEPLRDRRDPGVSALLARRCQAIAGTGKVLSIPDVRLTQACDLALRFTWWDEAGSLPTIKRLMTTCRERSLDPQQASQPGVYARYIAGFTIVRARAGDREALDEFAGWVRAIEPGTIEYDWREVLEPLWTYPEHPALSAAARAMFNDPKSRWMPLVPVAQGRHDDQYADQIASPLACVPAYREALLAALADRAKVGTAERKPDGVVHFTLMLGRSGGFGDQRVPDPADRPGIEVPIRVCDYVAWKLSTIDGAPECRLTWPEAKRDKAVAACVGYLRRYGPRLAPEYHPDDFTNRGPIAVLRFPSIGRPATPDDVREGRAVFSLSGEGEARAVALASGYPVRARWLALRSFPVDQNRGIDPGPGDFLQDGWVWQAEDVLKGDRRERFYGFVGHATIARVAASEIEFAPDRARRLTLKGGLAARVEASEPNNAVFRPGRPVVVMLRLYNALGVPRSAPTEFLRAGADGKPALRRGVTLILNEVPRSDNGFDDMRDRPARRPTRTDRFDPGDTSRTLAPTESFEALRLDLNDWYAGLKPGGYELRLTFGADSGLGEGTTNRLDFWIAEPDDGGR